MEWFIYFSHKLEEKHEELNFICPDDIDIFSVNGNDNYWIRARLVSGDYGKARLVQKTSRHVNDNRNKDTYVMMKARTDDTNEKTIMESRNI